VVCEMSRLLFAIADELGDCERERKRSGRQAAHRDHQRQPSGVRVGPLAPDAAEDRLRKQRGYDAADKDCQPRAEKMPRIAHH
jgi:hypothetical protein